MHASWKIVSPAAALLVVLAGAGCATGGDAEDAVNDGATLTAAEALDAPVASDPSAPPASPGPSVTINQNGAGDRNINIIGGRGHRGHHRGRGHHGCGGHDFHGDHHGGQGHHEAAAPSPGPVAEPHDGDPSGQAEPPANLGQGQR